MFSVSPQPHPAVEILSEALNVYATTSSLGGSAGSADGFQVSATGLGALSFNVGSDGGVTGSLHGPPYGASKAGLIGLTKTLARELARNGVTVNVVCPWPTDTPLFDNFRAVSPSIGEALERAIPLRRLGKPDDYAGMIAFLLSDDAGYITGQTISVSGGLTMS